MATMKKPVIAVPKRKNPGDSIPSFSSKPATRLAASARAASPFQRRNCKEPGAHKDRHYRCHGHVRARFNEKCNEGDAGGIADDDVGHRGDQSEEPPDVGQQPLDQQEAEQVFWSNEVSPATRRSGADDDHRGDIVEDGGEYHRHDTVEDEQPERIAL